MLYVIFALLGFLSGSVLYSELLPQLVRHQSTVALSDDGNPGAGNVFKEFGISLGIPCLICDILKGTVPVALCLCFGSPEPLPFALVLVAPVLGHARKGKAIAVSFGVLIGLLSFHPMVFYLVVPFLTFSLILRVNPHAWRVIASFACFLLAVWTRVPSPTLRAGALLISIMVVARHVLFLYTSHQKLQIQFGLGRTKN